MAITQTITIYRGEAITLGFTMAPVADVTGWQMVFTLSRARNSTVKLLTKTATVVDGPGGKFQVVLAPADSDITPGTYYFDVWRMDSGQERVLALGPFEVAAVARLGSTQD